MMFGRKIRTDQEMHERLDNPTALAVFASDALSSVAYATEEMLTVLLIGGAGLLAFGTLVVLLRRLLGGRWGIRAARIYAVMVSISVTSIMGLVQL